MVLRLLQVVPVECLHQRPVVRHRVGEAEGGADGRPTAQRPHRQQRLIKAGEEVDAIAKLGLNGGKANEIAVGELEGAQLRNGVQGRLEKAFQFN